jgi:uncharacterized membrane protein YjfL (UPF0719 family)
VAEQEYMSELITEAVHGGAFIALYLAVFMLAKWLKNACCSYNIDAELMTSDNLAVAVAMSGYYLGVAAIFAGALLGPSVDLLHDLTMVGGYAVLGLLMLNASRLFNERLILRKFCNTHHLITGHNVAVGVVHCGVYVATGLIAAGAVSGQGGNAATAVVFFVLGQFSLAIFSSVYEKLSAYDVHHELQNGNIAAGIAFAGNLIALSIIIMRSSSGDFKNWTDDLTAFAISNLFAFVFLVGLRWFFNRSVVPNVLLSKEILVDKNIGAGFLEAVLMIAASMVIVA